MKSKSLGITSPHYSNKQNYSNKLISQSSAFISNPPTELSPHSSQNGHSKTNIILLYLCLKYFLCSHGEWVGWPGPQFTSGCPLCAFSPCGFCMGQSLLSLFLFLSQILDICPLSLYLACANISILDCPKLRLYIFPMCFYSDPYIPHCRPAIIYLTGIHWASAMC